MQLGCFSVSLAVKDLQTSKAFYEKLGFTVFAGNEEHKYLILKNGDTNIGIFEGMFENNILTFNPGWNQDAQELNSFTDVRKLQEQLKSNGLEILQASDPEGKGSGPGSFVVMDPDGNPVLIDQHR